MSGIHASGELRFAGWRDAIADNGCGGRGWTAAMTSLCLLPDGGVQGPPEKQRRVRLKPCLAGKVAIQRPAVRHQLTDEQKEDAQ